MDKNEAFEKVFQLVREIPPGKVLNYKRVGIPLGMTGRQVGKIMAHCDESVPWWRVVDASGGFPVSKKNPSDANEQRDRLEKESVPFKQSGKVDLRTALWQFDA